MELCLLLTVHSFTRCFKKTSSGRISGRRRCPHGCSRPGVCGGSSRGADVAGRPDLARGPPRGSGSPGGTVSGPGCRTHSRTDTVTACLDLKAEVLGDALVQLTGRQGVARAPLAAPWALKPETVGTGRLLPLLPFRSSPSRRRGMRLNKSLP